MFTFPTYLTINDAIMTGGIPTPRDPNDKRELYGLDSQFPAHSNGYYIRWNPFTERMEFWNGDRWLNDQGGNKDDIELSYELTWMEDVRE